MLPNKIILWLSNDLVNKPLPNMLERQVKRGLEIKYCEDIRSYKKLIPALQQYPDDIIITIDDDVIYNYDVIELLYKSYQQYPDCVHALWAHEMMLDDQGNVIEYGEWKSTTDDFSPSKMTFPVGCAGILYPPHCLDDEVLNKDAFMSICPHADDVWFKMMALKKSTLARMIPTGLHERHYFDNPLWQDRGLTQTNVNTHGNDEQIKRVLDKYQIKI